MPGWEEGWCRGCRDVMGYRQHDAALDRLERQRENEAGRKTMAPLPSRFSFAVVGVTFVGGAHPYPDNIYQAEVAWQTHVVVNGVYADDGNEKGEGVPVVLIRNPDNPHDANAIEVHIPSVDTIVGHVPRALAARFAPRLDAGEDWRAWIDEVRIDSRHTDRPGIRVAVRKVER